MIEYYDSDDEGSSYAKKSSQFQIPAFKGRNDPEVYFRWERKVESIFANCIISEEKKVQLVQANFSNAAYIWWTELGRSRRWYRAPNLQLGEDEENHEETVCAIIIPHEESSCTIILPQ
ncbi:uncharacterized protein DS421_15g502570 [Arachis hypogaea]|nr:uncharacterized protein DS421_15g502570 [Arachis hypogaea]